MLIRSQDKLKLISMDGIKYLEIEQGYYADDKHRVWAVCGDDEATVIGVYSTQEKAEAVLDDIEASALNYDHAKDSGDNLFSYLMPADDDPWFDRRDDNESNTSSE